MIGYNQEWLKGQSGEVTAVFTIATRNAVLICQQLYLPWIPTSLSNLLRWRVVKICGPTRKLRIIKKDQANLTLRGIEDLTILMLRLLGKTKRKNLPKVLRDLNFHTASKLLLGVDGLRRRDMSQDVRWDKPVFSKREVSQDWQ